MFLLWSVVLQVTAVTIYGVNCYQNHRNIAARTTNSKDLQNTQIYYWVKSENWVGFWRTSSCITNLLAHAVWCLPTDALCFFSFCSKGFHQFYLASFQKESPWPLRNLSFPLTSPFVFQSFLSFSHLWFTNADVLSSWQCTGCHGVGLWLIGPLLNPCCLSTSSSLSAFHFLFLLTTVVSKLDILGIALALKISQIYMF